MTLIKRINITNEYVAQDILTLQKLAYEIEADLENHRFIPYLTQGLSDLMREEEAIYLAYYADDKMLGAMSFKISNNGVLDLGRMMVHPAHFRQGIASALMNHAKEHFYLRKIIAQTGAKNTPAIAFFKKNDLPFICDIQVNRRVRLATFDVVLQEEDSYESGKAASKKEVVD